MGFVVFSFLSWLFVSIFTIITKKLSIIENTVVFLLVLIISINYSWIVSEELKLITVTKKGLGYTAYLLTRSVIIPMVILIHLNFLQAKETMVEKSIVIFTSVLLLSCISSLSASLKITDYSNWHFGFIVIYYLILNLIAILFYKLFKRISQNTVSVS